MGITLAAAVMMVSVVIVVVFVVVVAAAVVVDPFAPPLLQFVMLLFAVSAILDESG